MAKIVLFGLIAILFTACLDSSKEAKGIFISAYTSEENPTESNANIAGSSATDSTQKEVAIIDQVAEYNPKKKVEYRLVLSDEFEKFNSKLWSRIPQGYAPWNKYMASNKTELSTTDTNGNHHLLLKGVENKDKTSDKRNFLTGGVTSSNNLAMQYGKIEIRCKLEDQNGAWPALWLMPQDSPNGWPNDGEIDLIERLNGNDFVYHVVHMKSGAASTTAKINPKNEFHIYALEWTPRDLVYKIDGKVTFTYKNNHNYDQFPFMSPFKKGGDYKQFPFVTPFFVYMTMQLEGWPGPVDASTLPVIMYIDYVKFYAAYQGDKRITRFVRDGREITESEVKALGD